MSKGWGTGAGGERGRGHPFEISLPEQADKKTRSSPCQDRVGAGEQPFTKA